MRRKEGLFVDTSGARRLLFQLTCVAGDVCARRQAAPTGAPMDWKLSIFAFNIPAFHLHLGLNCGLLLLFSFPLLGLF